MTHSRMASRELAAACVLLAFTAGFAWLTIGLREGRNREIRRALEAVGLTVNRLIRTSYGPFQLGTLGRGQVAEVPRKVLREQLGKGALG